MCRLIYVEKRLYIHDAGGKKVDISHRMTTLLTTTNCHSVGSRRPVDTISIYNCYIYSIFGVKSLNMRKPTVVVSTERYVANRTAVESSWSSARPPLILTIARFTSRIW